MVSTGPTAPSTNGAHPNTAEPKARPLRLVTDAWIVAALI
jgi:hypothetical protein